MVCAASTGPFRACLGRLCPNMQRNCQRQWAALEFSGICTRSSQQQYHHLPLPTNARTFPTGQQALTPRSRTLEPSQPRSQQPLSCIGTIQLAAAPETDAWLWPHHPLCLFATRSQTSAVVASGSMSTLGSSLSSNGSASYTAAPDLGWADEDTAAGPLVQVGGCGGGGLGRQQVVLWVR